MPPERRPIADRFWPKVDRRGPEDCWEWMASKCQGYGQIAAGGRGVPMKRAHRVAYELLVGPVPDGLSLDHLCRNRGCVNPTHLEPVDNKTNLMRGAGISARNAVKTHCKVGHPFDAENTYITSTGHRSCIECRRLRLSGGKFPTRQRRYGPKRSKAA